MSSSTWTELRTSGGAIPGRGGHATAVCTFGAGETKEHVAVIIGGADAFGMTSNTVSVVDIATGAAVVPLMLNTSRPQPAPRCSHAAAVVPAGIDVGGAEPREGAAQCNDVAHVLLFGGVTYVPHQEPLLHDDAWVLTLTKVPKKKANPTGFEASWAPFETTGVSQAGRRHSFASCVVGKQFIVACGADGTEPVGPEQTGYTAAVHALDLERREWRKLQLPSGAIGPAREMLAASAAGNDSGSDFVLSGGRFPVFDEKTGEPQPAQSSALYRVDTSKDTAAVVAESTDLCLIAHTVVPVDGGVLVVGGQGTPTPASPLGMNETDVAVTLPAEGPATVATVRRTDSRNTNAALHFGIGHSSAASVGGGHVAVVVGGMLPNEVGTAQRVWVRQA